MTGAGNSPGTGSQLTAAYVHDDRSLAYQRSLWETLDGRITGYVNELEQRDVNALQAKSVWGLAEEIFNAQETPT